MNTRDLLTLINATIALMVVSAENGLGCPEGHLYAQVMPMQGMDLELFGRVVKLARESGLVTVEGHLIRNTEKGSGLARSIQKEATA